MTAPWNQQPAELSGQQPQQCHPNQHQQWQPNQQQPQQWPRQPPAPRPARTPGSSRLIAGIAIGLITAIVVCAALVLTGVLNFGSSNTTATNGTPIELPTELAGMQDAMQVLKEHPDALADDADPAKVTAQAAEALRTAEQDYRTAYDGAGVGVRAYASASDQSITAVFAVRAPSPGLIDSPNLDPTHPNYSRIQRVVQIGDVQCQVLNVVAGSKGGDIDPTTDVTNFCLRTGSSLSVFVQWGTGDATGPDQQQQMTALTNAAFESVATTE